MGIKLAWILLAVAAVLSAEKRVIVAANGPKPIGPYSPGIVAGDFLYVSGQGARGSDGQPPASFEAAVRQALDNVKAIVEAAGLTMEHVVYTQIYLADTANYPALTAVLGQYFPRNPPARATLGVNHMPTDTPVEINAVAFRDLARKRAIVPAGFPERAGVSPGMLAGNRLYISGFLGATPSPVKFPRTRPRKCKWRWIDSGWC